MDRDAYVRASRRRLALDALAVERDREAMLVEQLEDVLAEAEGARVDDDVFAEMSPDDALLARAALGLDLDAEPEAEDEADADGDDFEFSLDLEDDEAELDADDPDDLEAEIARLQEVIESSRRVQAALERYLALLSEAPAA